MNSRLIECVPNFSEGRNYEVIDQIVNSIASNTINGKKVKVLNVDIGNDTNRTVITFVGQPETACEAAFQGVKAAANLIDMRQHLGTHPRSGATDVLPLVPISGISLEECAEMARELAKRIYTELGIACYCYEAAAFAPKRKNLAWCRSGEYEALLEKISNPTLKPDFGPSEYNEIIAKSGAINIGARNFLIAVNFNLNSQSVELATQIAKEVRESGYKDKNGKRVAGTLKGCKALGWYIKEYGIAQVSMNITDISSTPLHIAYEEVCRVANKYGAEITGTEIIGMVPKQVMLDAGLYFLNKQLKLSTNPDNDLITTAIKSMNLDDLCPFIPQNKIIELKLNQIDE
ncbi:MAG: glutamate formimidoyltransferase [Bacteroidaceae bacterium]|nr:glutamate formimidoyltransferase [Bacteroidaceae bacterium]